MLHRIPVLVGVVATTTYEPGRGGQNTLNSELQQNHQALL